MNSEKSKRRPKISNFLTNNVIFLVNLGKMCFLWPNYPLKINSGTRTDFNDVISPWIPKNQNGDQKSRILYGNIVHWIQILILKWIGMMFLLRKSKKKNGHRPPLNDSPLLSFSLFCFQFQGILIYLLLVIDVIVSLFMHFASFWPLFCVFSVCCQWSRAYSLLAVRLTNAHGHGKMDKA